MKEAIYVSDADFSRNTDGREGDNNAYYGRALEISPRTATESDGNNNESFKEVIGRPTNEKDFESDCEHACTCAINSNKQMKFSEVQKSKKKSLKREHGASLSYKLRSHISAKSVQKLRECPCISEIRRFCLIIQQRYHGNSCKVIMWEDVRKPAEEAQDRTGVFATNGDEVAASSAGYSTPKSAFIEDHFPRTSNLAFLINIRCIA